MAKLGFYNIVTIECLSREYSVKKFGFNPIWQELAAEAKKE